jgi:YggT family protein
MFVMSNFLYAAATVLSMAITFYTWILIARAVISWVNPDPYNPIVRFLYSVTEPVLYRVRRTFSFAYVSGIDFSPMIVILGLYFLQIFLVRSLQDLALSLH